ncbi:uncharacterized protein LOC126100818 [Schistocerca cancellata]|uniref:uncharacterized protein LOC126100818 n=1 Tax=Schistocerca cancellata TaxID=274614 RepID=UPI002119291E|nr:uncharacterized protein LOC126100818 [Schistocerca cancellata]
MAATALTVRTLLAVAAAVASAQPAGAWVWRSFADSGRYDRKFLFHGFPPILCGSEDAFWTSPWSGPAEVRVRLPSVHEEYCKVSLPRGRLQRTPVGRLLRELSLRHGLPSPVKYDGEDGGLVYRMDWPDFDCVERTNISETVFDFVIVEEAGGTRSRCNFVLPLFRPLPLLEESAEGDGEEEEGEREDDSGEAPAPASPPPPPSPGRPPHTGALVVGLRGLPDAVCRPLEEPAPQQGDADFFEPAFRAHRLADVPLVCQFRLDWDAWLRGVSTHALLDALARHVDVTVSDYDPSGWSPPDVSFPYVGCDSREGLPSERYEFSVTGPSGRTATCWFVPNQETRGSCYREQLDAACPPGFRFLSDGRCCDEPT